MRFFKPHYTGVAKVFQIALYTIAVLFGILTLAFPVPSISGVVGIGFVWTYGIFLTVGGITILYGTLKPNYKIELGALWLVAGGWLIYDISLWGVYFERLNNPTDTPPAYGPGLAVASLVIFYTWRIVFLSIEARKIYKAAVNVGIS